MPPVCAAPRRGWVRFGNQGIIPTGKVMGARPCSSPCMGFHLQGAGEVQPSLALQGFASRSHVDFLVIKLQSKVFL